MGTEVAGNLHANRAALEVALDKKGDVASIIREAPSSIREDLMRVVSSSGLVEAQGEFRIAYRTLPASAQRLRRKAIEEVAAALYDIPKSDVTRESSLDPTVVASLASATVEGSATLADFAKAAKGMLRDRASADGSYQALVEAWSLMEWRTRKPSRQPTWNAHP